MRLQKTEQPLYRTLKAPYRDSLRYEPDWYWHTALVLLLALNNIDFLNINKTSIFAVLRSYGGGDGDGHFQPAISPAADGNRTIQDLAD